MRIETECGKLIDIIFFSFVTEQGAKFAPGREDCTERWKLNWFIWKNCSLGIENQNYEMLFDAGRGCKTDPAGGACGRCPFPPFDWTNWHMWQRMCSQYSWEYVDQKKGRSRKRRKFKLQCNAICQQCRKVVANLKTQSNLAKSKSSEGQHHQNVWHNKTHTHTCHMPPRQLAASTLPEEDHGRASS